MKIAFVLNVISLVALLGCSINDEHPIEGPTDNADDAESSGEYSKSAFWLDVDERFAFTRRDGQVVYHPFFDQEPEYNEASGEITTLILSPYNSKSFFGLDLVSGQKYREFAYCKQRDVWESANQYLTYPNYTEAVVPRLMDQSWNPQRVIIFGRDDYYQQKRNEEIVMEKVRVVGGIVEQYCHNFPCPQKGPWIPRLILVAVDLKDERFNHITTLGELKRSVDWAYAKSFLENAKGRSLIGEVGAPSYRIVGSIDASKAIGFAVSKGHLFTAKELFAIRTSCHALYDYVWNAVGKLKDHFGKNRKKKRGGWSVKGSDGDDSAYGKILFESDGSEMLSAEAKKQKDVSLQMQEFIKRRVFQYESFQEKEEKKRKLREEEKKKVEAEEKNRITKLEEERWYEANKVSLIRFMKMFSKKYGETYYTCSRFVRPANINYSPDRNWFFAYFHAYFIQDQKYNSVFKCNGNTGHWVPNFEMNDGKNRYDKYLLMDNCSDVAMEQAFPKAVEDLAIKMKQGSDHFRYVAYDEGIGGSHRKIYSWVNYTGKKIKCVNKNDEGPVSDMVIPEDVRWETITNGNN